MKKMNWTFPDRKGENYYGSTRKNDVKKTA